ncbi:MAG: hypothetical protein JST68_13445, partial [Bacteroidetes bacterium]|nr:hypothetical protein [Bacteroidota bacterium]
MKESFPTLFEHSFNQSHFFWRVPYKLESRGFSELVLYHFETELESAAGDLELMTERTSSFITDLIKQKQVYPRSIILLDYLQFTAGGSLLSYFSKNKYFNYCFDWILNSLSNDVSTEIKRDFQPYKLMAFIQSRHPFIIETIDQVLPTWIHDLFYYSRHSGGNKELSDFCLAELLPWLLQTAQRNRSLEYVMALSQICTWCYNFKYDDKNRQVQKVMEVIYEKSKDISIKKFIAFHFSCLQENETSLSRDKWTDIILSTYSHLLVEHEQFQVLANRWEDNIDHILIHFDEIVFAIRKYTAKQTPFHGVLFNHIRSTLFTILHRMVATLLTHGHVGLTNRLYGAFFGIDDH